MSFLSERPDKARRPFGDARPLLIAIGAILTACGDSRDDLMGPSPDPSAATVFAYVAQMVGDPWVADSLPGHLTDLVAAEPIVASLRQGLPQAVETRNLDRLTMELERLRDAIEGYRGRPGFDPAEGAILSPLDLFVQQAFAIRDGTVRWIPVQSLRRDGG